MECYYKVTQLEAHNGMQAFVYICMIPSPITCTCRTARLRVTATVPTLAAATCCRDPPAPMLP